MRRARPSLAAAVLGAAGALVPLQWWMVHLYAPEMGAAVGWSTAGAGQILALEAVLAPFVCLTVIAVRPRRAGRPRLAAYLAAVSGALGLVSAVLPASSGWTMLLRFTLAVGAAFSVAGMAVHLPLLTDLFPPRRRLTSLSAYFGAQAAAVALTITGFEVLQTLGATWRSGVLLSGLLTLATAAALAAVEDPGVGRWEHEALEAAVPGSAAVLSQRQPLGEATARLLTARSFTPLAGCLLVLGMVTSAWATYLPRVLNEGWSLPRGDRLAWQAIVGAVLVVVLAAGTRWLQKLFTAAPARTLAAAAALLAAAAIASMVGALSTVLSVAAVEMVLGLAAALAVTPLLWTAILEASPPELRGHATVGIVTAGFAAGGLAGPLLLGSVYSRYGSSWAFFVFGLLLLIGGSLLRRSSGLYGDDRTVVADLAIEERTMSVPSARQAEPLLACRHVDFSYGPLQVLFDVDFSIRAGEMVALLGTNGAGKSTLLRVISGLALPQRGSVRLEGRDITYLSAEQRVAKGIVQVPGGRGVFGPLSIVENLRMYGYALGRSHRAVERGIDEVFAAFPALAPRRSQPASTLSGGEQQMLALGKSLILQPRLLLIDELSLGLAPRIVGELLEMVRKINATGTAVVLVEQSVNIALSLVQHAYFMEKGEMRFDGEASELMYRDDLVRSVFLGAAARQPVPSSGG